MFKAILYMNFSTKFLRWAGRLNNVASTANIKENSLWINELSEYQ